MVDIPRLLAIREHARNTHDWNLVAEVNAALDMVGYRDVEPAPPVTPVLEKRKPGRPRKNPISEGKATA